MEEEVSFKHDSSYANLELDRLPLVEALSRIKKLENEVALSRIRIDQCEKEKHDLIAVIKKLHDKFILSRLDSLMSQLDSNVSLLNEMISTMKRSDYKKYNLTGSRSDDRDIVYEPNPVENEPKNEIDGLTSFTEGLICRIAEYTHIQKLSEPHNNDDDDPIIIEDTKYHEVLTISDDDDFDRSDFQHVSRLKIPTIVELDDSSIQSISEDCYPLNDDNSNEESASRS